MAKKIYVPSNFENRDNVKKLMSELIQRGHTITADWTVHQAVSEMQPSKQRDQLMDRYVIEDTEGVEHADVFVLLLSDRKGTGSQIEFGVALGADVAEIYVVGDNESRQLFYLHPRVKKLASVKELLALL